MSGYKWASASLVSGILPPEVTKFCEPNPDITGSFDQGIKDAVSDCTDILLLKPHYLKR